MRCDCAIRRNSGGVPEIHACPLVPNRLQLLTGKNGPFWRSLLEGETKERITHLGFDRDAIRGDGLVGGGSDHFCGVLMADSRDRAFCNGSRHLFNAGGNHAPGSPTAAGNDGGGHDVGSHWSRPLFCLANATPSQHREDSAGMDFRRNEQMGSLHSTGLDANPVVSLRQPPAPSYKRISEASSIRACWASTLIQGHTLA